MSNKQTNKKGGSSRPRVKKDSKNKFVSRSNTQKKGSKKFFKQLKNQTQTTVPIALGTTIRNKMQRTSITVRHMEFVKIIKRTEPIDEKGSREVFPVNPGVPETFPWLSGIANNFESYLFDELEFHYVPSCGTTTWGSIVIAPDYDAADDNIGATRQELCTFDDSVRSSLWQCAVMKCARGNLRKMKTYFIRAKDNSQDVKTYDVANVIIDMRTGASFGSEMGELWVRYKVRLFTPQKEPEIIHSNTMVVPDATTSSRYPFGKWVNGQLVPNPDVTGDGTFQVENVFTNAISLHEPGGHILSSAIRYVSDDDLTQNTSPPVIDVTPYDDEFVAELNTDIIKWGGGPYYTKIVTDYFVFLNKLRSKLKPLKFVWDMITNRDDGQISSEPSEGINSISVKELGDSETERILEIFETRRKKKKAKKLTKEELIELKKKQLQQNNEQLDLLSKELKELLD
jgi:hypothetical protein